MANVVVGLGHANLELAVGWYAKLLTSTRANPGIGASQLVLATARNAFHNFWGAGVKGQGGGQNYADRFFSAIGQGNAVADTFAIKIHIGLGGDAHRGDAGSGHKCYLVRRRAR